MTDGAKSTTDNFFDLAGGETPPTNQRLSVDEVLGEGKSRRKHRVAAATLIYLVVFGLGFSVILLVFKLSEDLAHINPAAVGLVASLVVAVSVLTIALAKFSFGLSTGEAKPSKDAVGPPAMEAFKFVGDVLGKVADAFKNVKP